MILKTDQTALTDRYHVSHVVKYGAWQAEVVDRNQPPMNHCVADSCRYMVCLVAPNGFNTSWPIQYDDGRIGYNFEPSRDAKRAVVASFKWIGSQL